jgi:hypothetical protein
MQALDLEQLIKKFLAASYQRDDGATETEYHQTFKDEGARKSQYIIDDLINREIRGQLHTPKLVYLCIGGSDGSEVENVLRRTGIAHAVMVEISDQAAEAAKERARNVSTELGKEFRVITGDITNRLQEVAKELVSCRKKYELNGIVCSAQAVLHELPRRSTGFDFSVFFGRIYQDSTWKMVAFYSREPCKPPNWPEIVELSIKNVSGESLRQFALHVADRLGLAQRAEDLPQGWLQVSGILAVELLHKLLRNDTIRKIRYELEEQLTAFDPDLVRTILLDHVPGIEVRINYETTEGFSQAVKLHDVQFRDSKHRQLPIPHTHVRIVAFRNSDSQLDQPVTTAHEAVTETTMIGGSTPEHAIQPHKRIQAIVGLNATREGNSGANTITDNMSALPARMSSPPAGAFFDVVLPSDPELIEFATHSWPIDRPTEISPLITTAEVDRQVRNSNRWLLRGRTDYFLRQILRKVPAEPDRLASKHRLLWWLRHKFHFSTECPIRPVVAWADKRYCWAVPSATGGPYELYPLVRGGTTFDQQDNKLDLLIGLLVNLTHATQRLFTEHADIAQSLTFRLTRFGVRPRYEKENSLVSTARELQVLLTSTPCTTDVESVSEEMIACFVSHLDDPRFRQRLERLREQQPQRLVHGDMTENNLLIQRKRLWLFDWDNVSIQQSGPFDLAFALVRLANADRMGATLYPTSEETRGAERLLKLFNEALPGTASDSDVALALEQVRFEFSLRMMEYFEMLIADPGRPVDMPYVRRCNPGRPLAIRRQLIGDRL